MQTNRYKGLALSLGLLVTAAASAQTEQDEQIVAPVIDDENPAYEVQQIETDDSVCLAGDSTVLTMPWPQNVQAKLNRLVDHPMFETSQLGMMVYDLTADSAIFRHNERQMMRPASTMKVITAITAIDRLGGSFQFRTSLQYTGSVMGNTLNGRLYCVGGFDPLFNIDDMKAFIEGIRQMGVDTIRGAIVADKTMKEKDSLGTGWCWDDKNPILSPLLVSRKDNFVSRLVDELHDAGIVVEAVLEEGKAPEEAFVICTRFHTIDQVLMKMLKDSDNLFAESMFYQIAASTDQRTATAKQARAVIRRLVERVSPSTSLCKIADGSGLSLYNYISPEIEIGMLRYAFRNSPIYLHLYNALPVAGEDGTLKSRMRGTDAQGNVRAKTGTLTGISSLAGYLTAANGHTLCFCIINQGVMNGKYGRQFQDRVCQTLCETF